MMHIDDFFKNIYDAGFSDDDIKRFIKESYKQIALRVGFSKVDPWWADAIEQMQRLAEKYGITMKRVAAIVAVLSPMVPWSKNVQQAEIVLSRYFDYARPRRYRMFPRVMGFNSNKAKAWEIAKGANPDNVVSGPKVEAFYSDLLGRDDNKPTIDSWMFAAIAMMRPNWKGTPPRYNHLLKLAQEAIVELAKELGMLPRDLQSQIWSYMKKEKGKNL